MADNKIQIACQVGLAEIFVALHKKASEMTKKAISGIEIYNSAIDNKTGKFNGPGGNIIAVIPTKETAIKKSDAKTALQTYVQWFSGPDIKDKVTDDVIWPFEDEESNINKTQEEPIQQDKISEEPSAEITSTDKKTETPTSDSLKISIPSFITYLTEADKKSQDHDEKSTKTDDDVAKGYYLTYKLQIIGQKEHSLKNVLKTVGLGIIKNLGISSFNWRTGARGTPITIGNFIKPIDPAKFKEQFDTNFNIKYKGMHQPTTDFYKNRVIVTQLKNKLTPREKQKINNAEYSFCIKIPHTEKTRRLINPQVIANLCSQAMKKTFNADNVIFINGYSDSENSDENKKKLKTTTSDSIIMKLNGQLLYEDNISHSELFTEREVAWKLSISEKRNNIKPILEEYAKDQFKNSYKAVNIVSKKNLLTRLNEYGINDSNCLEIKNLGNTSYFFYIRTEENTKSTKTAKESINIENILNLIFESDENSNIKSAEIVFTKLQDDLLEDGYISNSNQEVKKIRVIRLIANQTANDTQPKENPESTTKTAESISEFNSVLKIIFENSENIFDELLINDTIMQEDSEEDKELYNKIVSLLTGENKDKIIERFKTQASEKLDTALEDYNNTYAGKKEKDGKEKPSWTRDKINTIISGKTPTTGIKSIPRKFYSAIFDMLSADLPVDSSNTTDSNINKSSTVFYVWPDDNGFIANNSKSDIEDNNSTSKNDFYIVPMKNIKFDRKQPSTSSKE